MISESHYWKRPLLDSGARLAKLRSAKHLSERKLARAERDFFIGFYTIRKLLESPTKLSDSTHETKLTLTYYAHSGKSVSWRNIHKLEDLYKLDSPRSELRDLGFLCGRIIHSYAFSLVESEKGGLYGFLFGSDFDKQSKVYFLDVSQVIQIFRTVGSDYPDNFRWRLDEATGREQVSAW